MLKVLLISASYIDSYGPIKLAAGRYFPLGLGYIVSVLKKNGYGVSLYEPEAQGMDRKAIKKVFAQEQPDLIGISSATPNFSNAIELAKLAKKECRCPVVYGGVHASAVPEFIVKKFSSFFDYIVIGEGEYTMLELLNCLERNGSPLEIPGLCFLHEGRAVTTPPRVPIMDLDTLPYPDRDTIPQGLFEPNMHNRRHKRCFTILTSRGCPFDCSFCASHLTMGKKYRTHSSEYVLGELTFLKKKYQAKQFIINDDTFTLDRERLVAICEGMIKRRLDLAWFCFSQITTVDKDLLRLMKRAGCYNIGFGIESASPRILESIGKKVPFDKCREIISFANKLEMKTQAYFVFGKSEETVEEVEGTIRYAIELNPTLAFFNMLVPYPGTRDFDTFFKDISLDDIEWKNFVAIGCNSVVSKETNMPINMEKMIYKANLRFYFRPRQLFHLLYKIKTLYEVQSYFKGGAGLILQMLAWRKNDRTERR